MKKLFSLLLTVAMLAALCACGGTSYKIGDTVATDIVELTLDDAKFSIALSNSSTNPGEPKEYDATADAKNPYVAAKGHTYAYVVFTLNNIDRDSIDIGGSFNDTFATVKYDGKTYNDIKFTAKRVYGETDWSFHSSSNILLSAGDHISYRGYIDVPAEPKEDESFEVTFYLPGSDGKTTEFKFNVTAEDSAAAAEAEKQRMDEIAAEKNRALEARKAEASADVVASAKAALQGEWEYTDYSSGNAVRHTLVFNGDDVTIYSTALGMTLEKEGTYRVCENDIFIDFYDSSFIDCFVPYTLENGSISLSAIENIK